MGDERPVQVRCFVGQEFSRPITVDGLDSNSTLYALRCAIGFAAFFRAPIALFNHPENAITETALRATGLDLERVIVKRNHDDVLKGFCISFCVWLSCGWLRFVHQPH